MAFIPISGTFAIFQVSKLILTNRNNSYLTLFSFDEIKYSETSLCEHLSKVDSHLAFEIFLALIKVKNEHLEYISKHPKNNPDF